jgi:flagellar biosynthesis protein FlhG
MIRIRCPKCRSKHDIDENILAISNLYQCVSCGWIIDVEQSYRTGRTILIASGKGGVGKSITSTNLAIALSKQGKKVVVIDANLGLANQHILMNVNTPYNLYNYIKGDIELSEIILHTDWDVDLIKGSAEIHLISKLSLTEQKLILEKLLDLESLYDFTIVDLPTGIIDNTKFYYRIAGEVIILTSPNITSISDTFRLIEAIKTINKKMKIGIILNMIKTVTEAEKVFDELANYCFKFQNVYLESYGYIFDNSIIDQSIQERVPLIVFDPECNVSKCFKNIAGRVASKENHFALKEPVENIEALPSFRQSPSLFLTENTIEERRIASRLEFKERLLYSYLETNSQNALPKRGPGISRNISMSGLLFKSPEVIPENKHILMTFNFTGNGPTRISGKVVHNHGKDDKDHHFIGVAFTGFMGNSKDVIEKVVARAQ